MAEEIKHRTIRYLQDAHAAQVGIEEALGSYKEDTENEGLKSLFDGLASGTRSQAQRIDARIKALGGDTSGGKNFFNSILAKATELMNSGHDDYDKNTQNIIKAYTAAHGNRGLFQSLVAWSEAIGDMETASLGKQLRDENASMAEQTYPHIEQHARTALAGTTAAS